MIFGMRKGKYCEVIRLSARIQSADYSFQNICDMYDFHCDMFKERLSQNLRFYFLNMLKEKKSSNLFSYRIHLGP